MEDAPNWNGAGDAVVELLLPALKLDPKENVGFCCPSFCVLPKTNILFVLPLALLALLAPKAGTDGLVVPKLVLVAGGVTPNRDLLSPNVRLGVFCVPKVFVDEEMPKASVAGTFAPNMGTDGGLLSVEPNIPAAPRKVGPDCTFVVVPKADVPNAGVVLFVVLKPEVIALVETLPVMPNAGPVVSICVVELNNGAVVLPNIPLAAPKDVEAFVWPKTGVPLPNIDGTAVVGVELTLALENKLELGVLPDDDTTLVVDTKIEGAVVGVLNILVVSDVVLDPDAVPKSG